MNRISSGWWAVLVLFVSTLAAGFDAVDVASPLRVFIVLGFLLFVPGSAIVRLFCFDELAVQLALGTGLSVSLGGIVAGVLLYAGAWSPGAALAILIGIALTAVGVEFERATGGVSSDLARLVDACSRVLRRQGLNPPGARVSHVEEAGLRER